MGKRSNFKRRAQDAYDTPAEAVAPLLKHLPATYAYWEPCVGSGALVDALTGGDCVACSDIQPRGLNGWIQGLDALEITEAEVDRYGAEFIITNPPWTRSLLHPMIEHFARLRPTWLLFDADWMHTKQAAPYLLFCHKVVSVGRVSWMGNGQTGKDNCAWYLFDYGWNNGTKFYGREVSQ